MNVRAQLLIASSLALLGPLLGWQSIKHIDNELVKSRIDVQDSIVADMRSTLLDSDEASSELITFLDSPTVVQPSQELFAEKAKYRLFVDGYDEDWVTLSAAPVQVNEVLSLRVAEDRNRVFLFINFDDDELVYHKPLRPIFNAGENESIDKNKQLVNGDSIELIVKMPSEAPAHYLFRALAPGRLSPILGSNIHKQVSPENPLVPYTIRRKSTGDIVNNLKAYFVVSEKGAQLEISMLSPPVGTQFAIAYRDVDSDSYRHDSGQINVVGDFDPALLRSDRWRAVNVAYRTLYQTSDMVNNKLASMVGAGSRARLYDKYGRLVADANALYELTDIDRELDPARGTLLNAVLFRLFSMFSTNNIIDNTSLGAKLDGFYLSPGDANNIIHQPLTTLYDTQENDRVLGTVVSLSDDEKQGYLLYETRQHPGTAYASSSDARFFSMLTLLSLLMGGFLFVYSLATALWRTKA